MIYPNLFIKGMAQMTKNRPMIWKPFIGPSDNIWRLIKLSQLKT